MLLSTTARALDSSGFSSGAGVTGTMALSSVVSVTGAGAGGGAAATTSGVSHSGLLESSTC